MDVLGLDGERHPARDADAVAAAVATFDNTLLTERLQARGVPAAPVLSPVEVIEDPQLNHREHWRRLPHAEMGDTLYNGQPFSFRHSVAQPIASAPLLGEHTDEICAEILELTPEEIAHLRRTDVLT